MLTRLKNAFLFWLKCLVSNTEEERRYNASTRSGHHC